RHGPCKTEPAKEVRMALIRHRGRGEEPVLAREVDPFQMARELMRWDPFAGMLAPVWGVGRAVGFTPEFDVKETNDAYVFKADLPGVKESDLDISITGNRLTISGKREAEETKEGENYFTYERTFGSFTRAFTLPAGVDTER